MMCAGQDYPTSAKEVAPTTSPDARWVDKQMSRSLAFYHTELIHATSTTCPPAFLIFSSARRETNFARTTKGLAGRPLARTLVKP